MALIPYPSLATLPEVVTNSGKVPPGFLNPSWISLRYDLGIPSDATIEGIGSPSPSDAGYGTRDLPALATPIGARPPETVTQRIQAALDLAASGPLGLLWDARCSVGAQAEAGGSLLNALLLRRPGNIHVAGRPGCGAILRAQSNAAILAVEPYTGCFGNARLNAGTNSQVNDIANIAFGNAILEGLYLNANSGITVGTPESYTPGPNQTSPTFGQIYYLNALRFFGVRGITLRRSTIVGAGGFHTYWGNWQRVTVEHCTIDSQGAGGTVGGNDCLHFNGPGDDATILHCHLATSDDHIALNCCDGNNQGGLANVPAWGSITNVRAFNTTIPTLYANGNFARISTGAGCINSGHVFDGVRGTVAGLALLLSSATTASGRIGTVDFRNLNADWSSHGIRAYAEGTALGGVGRIGVAGVRRFGSHLALPLLTTDQPIGRLEVCELYVADDGTSGSSLPQVQVLSGGSIASFSASSVGLDGFASGRSMPILQVDAGGSVPLARVMNAGAYNVAAIVSNAGTIGRLIGTCIDPSVTLLAGTSPGAHSGDYYL